MNEHPILFNAEMVRAILAGTKTQTRRVIIPKLSSDIVDYRLTKDNVLYMEHLAGFTTFRPRACPYGVPGDRLWVRETFSIVSDGEKTGVCFRVDGEEQIDRGQGECWKPSIFMPRWASRITLEIVNVRVERVQDICERDLKAEGCPEEWQELYLQDWFAFLWNSINAKRGYGWDTNCYVWVLTFKVV